MVSSTPSDFNRPPVDLNRVGRALRTNLVEESRSREILHREISRSVVRCTRLLAAVEHPRAVSAMP